MRPKVVIAILLVALGVLGIAALLSQILHPQPQPMKAQSASNQSSGIPSAHKPETAAWISVAPTTIITNEEDTNAPAMLKEEHENYVERRDAELEELAMQTNDEAHQEIVSELKNSDSAIRKAALDALMQAGDRSVIPQMQQIADQTSDPEEKHAILDAIDYINLPSLTEHLQQQGVSKPSAANTGQQ